MVNSLNIDGMKNRKELFLDCQIAVFSNRVLLCVLMVIYREVGTFWTSYSCSQLHLLFVQRRWPHCCLLFVFCCSHSLWRFCVRSSLCHGVFCVLPSFAISSPEKRELTSRLYNLSTVPDSKYSAMIGC